eukprot:203611_1
MSSKHNTINKAFIEMESFQLDLNESAVGDIVFIGENGMQIQSNKSIPNPSLCKSWNLSNTGSFEMKGLKIKNGIKSPPTNIATMGNDKNILHSIQELEFVSNIGQGATGTVKKAKHKASNQLLAIKCIDFSDKNARKQFMDEICLYLTLEHPFIVSFKGCCINHDTEQLYLALEYCSNGSLDSFVTNNGCFDELQCKKLSVQIISALAYLEFNKIIHRDIKPRNILLDDNFNAKLADFGIQKNLLKTFAKTQIGTMIYMSPQRMNGQKYSYKSDIWSFGLTLLFCVFGYFPYMKQNTNQKVCLLDIHIAIVEEQVPKLPKYDKNGKEFSIQFQSFIQACLYKKTEKRWKASDLLMHPFLTDP